MDCSLPGSSVHEISQEEYWSGLTFPSAWYLPNQGLNLHLLHWELASLPPSHQLSPYCALGQVNLVAQVKASARKCIVSNLCGIFFFFQFSSILIVSAFRLFFFR